MSSVVWSLRPALGCYGMDWGLVDTEVRGLYKSMVGRPRTRGREELRTLKGYELAGCFSLLSLARSLPHSGRGELQSSSQSLRNAPWITKAAKGKTQISLSHTPHHIHTYTHLLHTHTHTCQGTCSSKAWGSAISDNDDALSLSFLSQASSQYLRA